MGFRKSSSDGLNGLTRPTAESQGIGGSDSESASRSRQAARLGKAGQQEVAARFTAEQDG